MTMEVSLRRASQIINAIQRRIEPPREEPEEDVYGRRRRRHAKSVNPLAVVASVDVDTADVAGVLARRAELRLKMEMTWRLMGVLTVLRKAVGGANHQCGIASLVTSRAGLLRKQQILDGMIKELTGASTLDECDLKTKLDALRERIAAMAARPSSRYGEPETPADKLSVPLLTAADHRDLQRDLLAVNRRLVEIDDQLSAKNASNKIVIDDGDAEVLEAEGII
jgi:hypothetical protein